MTSSAATPDAYVAELPEDRRAAIQAIRETILANLPEGYAETMQYGMISYVVPHSIYPAGYHCDPKQAVPFVSLASQKNHMAVYMMCLYSSGEEERFREEYAKTGKKLDMGKCCIRFKRLENLALDLVGEMIAKYPVEKHIAHYEAGIKKR